MVVLSPASMDSVYVNRETSMAMVQDPQHIRILPILYQPCSIHGDLKPIQYVSFAPPNRYDQGLEEVLGALGLDVSLSPPIENAESPREESLREARRSRCCRRTRSASTASTAPRDWRWRHTTRWRCLMA